MGEPDGGAWNAASRRWRVSLYEGGFIVDACDEHEARVEALNTVAESLDWFKVVVETDEKERQ